MVALAKNAHMLVQLALAWAVCVCVFASVLTGQRPPWFSEDEDEHEDEDA
jgi:hypothetical protein